MSPRVRVCLSVHVSVFVLAGALACMERDKEFFVVLFKLFWLF